MRLPVDAVLVLVGEDLGEAPLVAAWAQERLPILRVPNDALAADKLEAALEEIGATTLVITGPAAAAAATARGAAGRGFRVFLVADAPLGIDPEVARIVTPETAVAAALRARNRERWKAAREAALLEAEEAISKR